METTWIIVADRSGARIFAHVGRGTGLKPVEEFSHPEGRLRNRDIDAGEPGRSYDSLGHHRHAMSPEQSATERETERFAQMLGQRLEQARNDHHYQKLVLVAEPGLLGVLRDKLEPQTRQLISGSLARDLMHVPEKDLPAHLAAVISL